MDTTVSFILTKKNCGIRDLNKDFDRIIDQLGTYQGIILHKSNAESLEISYSQVKYKAFLKLSPSFQNFLNDYVIPYHTITLVCDSADNVTINLLRNFVVNLGFRIFDPAIMSYLPSEPNLISTKTLPLELAIINIFQKNGFKPIYNFRNSLIFYAIKYSDKSIHLINRFLLQYYLEHRQDWNFTSDFSFEVSPDIDTFVALFDRGLIPTNFYQNFRRKHRINNLSGFNSDSVETDLYLTPIFFELDRRNQTFRQKEIQKTPFKAKVSKNNSFHQSIKQILKQTLGITHYLAAKASSDIDFTKENGKLIPVLSISIFLDNIKE